MRDHLKYTLSIIKTFFGEITKDTKILDLGCGSGWLVNELIEKGYNAYGCDINFKKGEHVEKLVASNRIKIINNSTYKLPFEDNEIDIVISFQVLEHVHDYKQFAAENRRVLNECGSSIHVFPATWRPLESHIWIPFGGGIQWYPWFRLFTALGFHKKKQSNLPSKAVARKNFQYIKEHTNYIGRDEIKKYFLCSFSNVAYSESEYFQCSQHKITRFLSVFPFKKLTGWCYGVLWRRVLVLQ